MSIKRQSNFKKRVSLHEINDMFIIWFPKTFTYREVIFNSPFWPSTITQSDKVSYSKGSNVDLKIGGSNVSGIVLWRGQPSKASDVIKHIETLIADCCNSDELTDSLLSVNLEPRKRSLILSSSSSESESCNDELILAEKKRKTNILEQSTKSCSSQSLAITSNFNDKSNTFSQASNLKSLSNQSFIDNQSLTEKSQEPSVLAILQSILEVNKNIYKLIKEDLLHDTKTIAVQIKKQRLTLKHEIMTTNECVANENMDSFYTDDSGVNVKLCDISSSENANKFAACFVDKVYGKDFLEKHIIEPDKPTKSQRIKCSDEIVQSIKKVLRMRFAKFHWEDVKRFLNQRGRDQKKSLIEKNKLHISDK